MSTNLRLTPGATHPRSSVPGDSYDHHIRKTAQENRLRQTTTSAGDHDSRADLDVTGEVKGANVRS